MKVLSLFDGISCGMVALDRVGIDVEVYDAYEIDENAIKISEHNYPNINHKGDVFSAVYSPGSYDLLIGGSPCTYWSIANSGREITSDGVGFELFREYVRALEIVKPKWFLYENNKSMADGIREEITKYLGVTPVYINSKDFSGQNRQRLYWTNIEIQDYTPCNIKLSDILENGCVDRDKSLCITRRYAGYRGSESYLARRYFGKSFGQAVFLTNPVKVKDRWLKDPYYTGIFNEIRPLTVVECERLQTLPDNYTKVDGVNQSQRIECIGNGWTVDVIAHILQGIKEN